VKADVKPYALMVGVPARQVGWISEFGEQLQLPLEGDGRDICQNTGKIYILENGYLRTDDK
jgi:UDP-2-acetamido-3-amino-2,3-dideoxy-glucuronate N-acetyltransferase